MKEGAPKFEASERIKSGKEVGELLRQKLLDVLDPVIGKFFDTKETSKDFWKLDEVQKDTEKLSAEAGEFFRSLIPEGLRKPEIDGEPRAGSFNWIMHLEHSEALKLFNEEVRKLSRKEYKEQKKEILKDSLHGRERVSFEGEVKETEKGGGRVDQVVINAFEQDGGENIIYERIYNTLNQKWNTSRAEASLVIQGAETGTTLDLNALLPWDYKFLPRAMDKQLGILIGGYEQVEVANLEDYKMGKSDPEGFAVRPFYKTVDYGDLREKGGMLSLLHEVAHTWQNKYYHTAEHGKAGFERLYKRIESLIYKLNFSKLSKDNKWYEDPEKTWEQIESLGIKCLNKDGIEAPLSEEGVINIPNIPYSRSKLVEKSIASEGVTREKLEMLLEIFKQEIRFYPIKSEILTKAMDSYVAEERDAWAHAIRTVRFLRQKGLDVEPGLQKLEDFKGKIDPCLASYQNSHDMIIINHETGYRFSKNPKV